MIDSSLNWWQKGVITLERAELAITNQYYISKHRMYELKHFCRQYPEWRRILNSLSPVSAHRIDEVQQRDIFGKDPTLSIVEIRDRLKTKMGMVEEAAIKADPVIGRYIFEAVTEGLSYDKLRARMNVPCSKAMYYDYYHKFFWLLDQSQDLQVSL